MIRCMMIASSLFDSFRSRPKMTRNSDGSIDEAMQVTPGQYESIERTILRGFALGLPVRLHMTAPQDQRSSMSET